MVYYFDSQKKSWTPTAVGNEFCRVDMYENPSNGTYRAIGRGLKDTSKVFSFFLSTFERFQTSSLHYHSSSFRFSSTCDANRLSSTPILRRILNTLEPQRLSINGLIIVISTALTLVPKKKQKRLVLVSNVLHPN